MISIRLFSSLVIFFAASAAHADAKKCFTGRLPVFAVHAHTKGSIHDKKLAVYGTCQDLAHEDSYRPKSKAEKAIDDAAQSFAGGFFGHWAAKFSRLDGTPFERRYQAQIDHINKQQGTFERVRQAYELAARHSGEYDDATMSVATLTSGWLIFSETPENLLANYEKRGTVGVCREFASLLVWTINQVARPTEKGTPDVRAFPVGGRYLERNHAWVRVKFASGLVMDFDSLDNQHSFTPLAPRRITMSERTRQRALRECEQVSACLATAESSSGAD